MVTPDEIRALAQTLPRSYEVFVRGRIKFRVGQIVFIAFSRDQQIMGFGFPKEQRDWLIGGAPEKFLLPPPADLRYHWVEARLAALGRDEMEELVVDAWRMCVPKGLADSYQPEVARLP
ncbi:MAG: MmcQ/YjbR family DNA-binding protein [Chloroflexi bacterium]|nr:MAG: MmcQ/YjbR family DNA-binding protein [Chloroflexota bacterium]